MEDELKPCPFCGATGRTLELSVAMGDHWVLCGHCHCNSGCYNSDEAVIRAWNQRVC